MSLTTSAGLKCTDLYSYLKTLPPATLDKLYSHPASCLAVFRDLPIISRHYIVRLLFVDQPVPQAVVSSWNEQKYAKEHLEALEALTALRIWTGSTLPGGLPGWCMSAVFRKNIQIALAGGGEPWAVYNSLKKSKHGRDVAFLDQYAAERWECVLHFMAGCHASGGIGADAVRILLHAGLMKLEEEEGSSPLITMEGFQFLLMDTPSQVWHFLLQYLDTIEDYSTEGMSESQLVLLQHLREFGVVYQRKRKSGRFYPTRHAINLASGLKETSLQTYETGYIMVETNYRVYAYTNSQLQVALLALFCELLYRFPNLVVGRLTWESVRQALRSGITANQIIKFLRMYAHPEALKQPSVIPATIMDQLQLWELERERSKYCERVLYGQFISRSDFELLKNCAEEEGHLTYQCSRNSFGDREAPQKKKARTKGRQPEDEATAMERENEKKDDPALESPYRTVKYEQQKRECDSNNQRPQPESASASRQRIRQSDYSSDEEAWDEYVA